jgi:hypothetical protein
MDSHDREWLLHHLRDQVTGLSALVQAAVEHPQEPERLLIVRDEVFTTRETLGTLSVPLAVASNEQWKAGRRD